MKASLRRRLEVLEAAHGKTPLGMARIRSILAMTAEEFFEVMHREQKILKLIEEQMDNPDDVREVPSSYFECFSEADMEWLIHYLDDLFKDDPQDEQGQAEEVGLKHDRRRTPT